MEIAISIYCDVSIKSFTYPYNSSPIAMLLLTYCKTNSDDSVVRQAQASMHDQSPPDAKFEPGCFPHYSF